MNQPLGEHSVLFAPAKGIMIVTFVLSPSGDVPLPPGKERVLSRMSDILYLGWKHACELRKGELKQEKFPAPELVIRESINNEYTEKIVDQRADAESNVAMC
jgi:hypothetical protein